MTKSIRPTLVLALALFLSVEGHSSLFSRENSSRPSFFLKKTLKTLSKDSYEGRRAGSAGGTMAEDYLMKKMKKMKVATLGDSYKQEFTIFTRMIKDGVNTFSSTSLGEDPKFQPLSISLSGKLEDSELVFAGFGISIPQGEKLVYDDYKNLDVKGKTVVVLTADPGVGNQSSLFRDPKYLSYRSTFYKVRNAITHGAKGIILVQDPMSLDDPSNEPDPLFEEREGGGERFGIVGGQTSIAYMNKVLKEAGKTDTVLSLQEKLAKEQRPSSFSLGKLGLTLNVNLKKETGRVSNIIGYVKGTDPELSKKVIVIGAHMDHLGYGGHSSMDPRHLHEIHNGADDNASGTALVMDVLKTVQKKPLKHSLLAVLFNAEEMGLLGSDHFVKMWARHQEEYGEISYMLNFDMVGRFNKEVQVMGTGSSFEWQGHLENLYDDLKQSRNAKHLLPMSFEKTAVGSSDHYSFMQAKIPALFFTTGAHEDYHRHTDDSQKIDFKALGKITYFAKRLLRFMDQGKAVTFDPDFLQGNDQGRNRGYGAHLGCVPKFGQDDSVKGVLCTRTTPGSPAEKAGVQGGDYITKIGEVEINNIYDLAFALKFYRAGDKIELGWKRGRNAFKAQITLARRNSNKNHQDCHHFFFEF